MIGSVCPTLEGARGLRGRQNDKTRLIQVGFASVRDLLVLLKRKRVCVMCTARNG